MCLFMPNPQDKQNQRSQPAPRRLIMTPKQSALLMLLLCDNAKTWNAPLRSQLGAQITQTELFNMAVDLREGRV